MATPRARGRILQRRRARLFRRQPLCVHCLAKDPPETRLATERDHVVPLSVGGADDYTNEQALCADCHAAKSIAERGARRRPRIHVGLDGFPLDDDPN